MNSTNYFLKSSCLSKSSAWLKTIFTLLLFSFVFTEVSAQCTPPAIQASWATPNYTVTSTTATLNFVQGSSGWVIILGRQATSVNAFPVNGTTYNDSTLFGFGSQIGLAAPYNYVVYIGQGTSVTVTGLTPNTQYTFALIAFDPAYPCYKTTGAPQKTLTTSSCAPATGASNPRYTYLLEDSVTLAVHRGNGQRLLVVARQGGAVNANPTYNTCYTANNLFGTTGTQIGTGNFVVYNGTDSTFTVRGLSSMMNYYFAFYEFNENPCCYVTGSQILTYSITTLDPNPGTGPLMLSCRYQFSTYTAFSTIYNRPADSVKTVASSAWGVIDDHNYFIPNVSALVNGSGFKFTFNGQDYTSFGINTNGFIWFSTIPGSQPDSMQTAPIGGLTVASGAIDGVISAAGADLIQHYHLSAPPTPSAIKIYIHGVAPSRYLTIEWTGFQAKSIGPNSTCWQGSSYDDSRLDFQIKLYEKNSGNSFSNCIELAYRNQSGWCRYDPYQLQIGIRGSSSGDFLNRTGNGISTSSTSQGTLATAVVYFNSGAYINGNVTFRYLNTLNTPTILPYPFAQTICPYEYLTLSITSPYIPGVSYQWFKDGNLIPMPGSQGQTLTATVNGLYYVRAYNSTTMCYGASGQTNVIILPCCQPPVIYSPLPVEVMTCIGDSILFSVLAFGDEPLSYQWQKDSVIIQGANSSSFVIQSIDSLDVGQFTVIVNNACGTAYSTTILYLNIYPPKAFCIDDKTLMQDPGTCYHTAVAADSLDPEILSNCTVTSVTNSFNSLPSLIGAQLPTGSTVITWYVTDINGDVGTCSYIVTVSDNQPPTLTCPSVLNLSTDPGLCGAYVNLSLTYSDNCPGYNLIQMDGRPSGTFYPVGKTINTFRVIDAAGNSEECTFNVFVRDFQLPVIVCDSNQTKVNLLNKCFYSTIGDEFDYLSASDNCSFTVTNSANGLSTLSGYNFSIGTSTIIWTIRDSSDNESTCSMVVTVQDIQYPQIVCAEDAVKDNTPGLCGFYVTNGDEFDPQNWGDNCWVDSLTNNYNNASTLEGSVFPLGETQVVWYAIDPSGNIGTCELTVIVNDIEAPHIECMLDSNQFRFTQPSVCYYTAIGTEFDPGVLYDNCNGGNVTRQNSYNSDTTLAGAVFPKGYYTVVWTAWDSLNNVSSCTFHLTVTDPEPPVIFCHHDTVRNTDAGELYYTVNGPEFDGFDLFDNCPGVTMVNQLNQNNTLGGYHLPIDTNVIIWTAYDASGHSASCSQIVIVLPSEPPTITCPHDTTVYVTADVCSYTVPGITLDPPSYTGSGAYITNSYNDFGNTLANEVFPLGTTTIIWTVHDVYGNTATCSFVIIVVDTIPPVLVCAGDQSRYTNPGLCSYDAVGLEFDPISVSDNCGGVISLQNDYNGLGTLLGAHFDHPGTYTIIWTAIDEHENVSTCTIVVTIADIEPPHIFCPPPVGVGLCFSDSTVNIGTATAYDNCGIDTITNDAPHVFPIGITIVTWTATDIYGNTAICTQTVAISNPIDVFITKEDLPVFCPEQAVVLTAHTSGMVMSYLWSTSETTQSIHVSQAGLYSVTVTNAAGCSGSASINVILDISNILASYVILTRTDLQLEGTKVNSGGIGVTDNYPGVFQQGVLKVKNLSMVINPGTFARSSNLQIDNTSQVTHRYYTAAQIPFPPFEPMPYLGAINVIIPAGATVTLNDTLYKEVKVGKNATAIFSQNVVNIDKSIKMDDGATLKFAECTKVRVKGNFDVGKNVTINPEGRYVELYIGTDAHIKEGANFTGVFYFASVKNGVITYRNMTIDNSKATRHGIFTGVYLAQSIHSGKNTEWNLGEFCNNCTSQPPVAFECPEDMFLCFEDSIFDLLTLYPPQIPGIVSITTDQPAVFPIGITVVTWTITDINGNVMHCTQTVIRLCKIDMSIAISDPQPCKDFPVTLTAVANDDCVQGGQLCFESPTIPDVVNAVINWTYWTFNPDNTLTIRTTFAKTFVDNTYGVNAIGWPNGHTFGNLVGSDRLQLTLYDNNNAVKMVFTMDYISLDPTAPSGYNSLGVLGAEGSMQLGNASDIVSVTTSLAQNFNTYGYVLTTNSPATDTAYTPNPTYPYWIYDVWYEARIKLSAFGPAGFQKPNITYIHASPSKTGSNSEDVIPVPCADSNFANYNYVWSTGAHTESISINSVGVYSVTATNINGCTASASMEVTSDCPPVITFECPDDMALCSEDSALQLIPSLYPLQIPGIASITNDQPAVFPLGVTVVTWTITDVYGNVTTCTQKVTRLCDINLHITSSNTSTCPPLPVTLTANTNSSCYYDGMLCYESPTIPDVVNAQIYWTYWTLNGDNTVTIRTTFAKTFVDNTYGANAIGWPGGHSFGNLVGSDRLQLALYDASNVLRMQFSLDYISATSTVPSGYKSMGVWANEGFMMSGNASDVVSAVTSLDKNFNAYGYWLTVNSPATDTSYTPNPQYPNWIYDVWYEVTVKLSAFGTAGFGQPNITYIHASPSKTGHNSESVVPVPCNNVTLGNYSYLWSTGATTQTITATNYGTYSVTVTTPTGCGELYTYNLSCTFTPITCPQDMIMCNNQGVYDLRNNLYPPVVPGYTSITNDQPAIFPLGNTVVHWTFVDVYGNTTNCAQNVYRSAPFSLEIDQAGLLCNSDITLTAVTSGTPATSFLWSTGETTDVIHVTTPGTYSVTATNAEGCVLTASATVQASGSSDLLSSYVILTRTQIVLTGSKIMSGGVGVTNAYPEFTQGILQVKSGSLVTASGTFAASNNLQIDNSSLVTNQVNTAPPIKFPKFEAMPYHGTVTAAVASNATVYLSDTLYKEVKIGKNATAIFTQSIVNVEKGFKMEAGSTIKFQQQCTKVRLNYKFECAENITINPDMYFVSFYINKDMTVKAGANVTGAFFLGSVSYTSGDTSYNHLHIEDSKLSKPAVFRGVYLAECVHSGKNTNWYLGDYCSYNCSHPKVMNVTGNNTTEATGITILNYPNPFNETTNIMFTLPQDDHVILDIYNVEGKLVENLYNGSVKRNQEYNVEFNGKELPTGIYLYKVTTNENVYTGKMMLTKE